jgi:PAS domain S-box-containing protein
MTSNAGVVVLSSMPDTAPSWTARVGAPAKVASDLLDASHLRQALSGAACILIDAGVESPFRVARNVHAADPALQVIVVAPNDATQPLERDLLFQPGLGEIWIVGSQEVSPALCESAAAVTTRRRKHARTRRGVERIMERSSPHALGGRSPSDAYVSLLLQMLPDAVFSTDPLGVILFANHSAAVLLGLRNDELIGRRLASVLDVNDDSELVSLLRSTELAPRQERMEFRRAGGERGQGVLRAASVEMNGSTIRVVVLHDQSEEERARAKLAAAQRQLVAADRMSSLGAMAAGIAHEVNNPLAYVIPNLQLALARLDESNPVAHLIGDALNGAERISKVVLGLKVFSRMNESEEKTSVVLSEVVEAALKLTTHQLAHRARVVRSYEAQPIVMANEPQLVQVFVNLLLNAAHAMPDGHAAENEVRVSVRNLPDGKALAEVRDTGFGMAPEVVQRVFEPFFTTKDVGEGTGLGLSITHGIVESHGGTISAESKLGAGSTFTITLPRAERAPQRVPSATEVRAVRCPDARARILLIDDEPQVLRVLQRILQDHDLLAVSDPREALELLTGGQSFDLVFCDLMMPSLSGIALYQAVSESRPDQAARFVFTTGGAFTEDGQRFLELHAARVVRKPFDVKAVRALVAEQCRASVRE